MLAMVQRQESPTAGRHNVEMAAQVVSLWCRNGMWCAPVMHGTTTRLVTGGECGTIRLTETQIKNNAVKSVGSHTRTRQVLVMGIRQ